MKTEDYIAEKTDATQSKSIRKVKYIDIDQTQSENKAKKCNNNVFFSRDSSKSLKPTRK